MASREEQMIENQIARMNPRRTPEATQQAAEAPTNVFAGKMPGDKLALLTRKLKDAKRETMLFLPRMSALLGHEMYAEMQLVNATTMISSGVLPPAGRAFLAYAIRHSEEISEKHRDKLGMQSVIDGAIAAGSDLTETYTGMMQVGQTLAVLSVANIYERIGPVDPETGKPELVPNRPAIGLTLDKEGKGLHIDLLPEEDLQLISAEAWKMIEVDAGMAEPFLRPEDAAAIARQGENVLGPSVRAGRADAI